jgi:hypothetical protein
VDIEMDCAAQQSAPSEIARRAVKAAAQSRLATVTNLIRTGLES